ncbi:hypothetical protein SAMN05661107_3072 [Maritimibacter sp. HL-12]|nr:hypothetical protein SAMN05661107_3072 [Maritimibacter sp. HL-12]
MAHPRITVAMLGARMHYAVPRILHQAGMLHALVTDAYLGDGALRRGLARLAGLPGMGARLRPALGRYHPDLSGATIVQAPGTALIVHARRKRARDKADWRAAKHLGARQLAALIERDPPREGGGSSPFTRPRSNVLNAPAPVATAASSNKACLPARWRRGFWQVRSPNGRIGIGQPGCRSSTLPPSRDRSASGNWQT